METSIKVIVGLGNGLVLRKRQAIAPPVEFQNIPAK